MLLRIYFILMLLFFSSHSFALSAAGARAATSRAASEVAQTAGGTVGDALVRSGTDSLAINADKQAAADQAEADRLRKIATDLSNSASSPSSPQFTYCDASNSNAGSDGAIAHPECVSPSGDTSGRFVINPSYKPPVNPADIVAANTAADAAQSTATLHKSAADTLNSIADVVLGRNISLGRSANGAQKQGPGLDLSKNSNPSANKDYLAKNAPNPYINLSKPNPEVMTGRGSNPYPDGSTSSGCVAGDTRVQCQVPDYQKNNAPDTPPSSNPPSAGSCGSCCEASDPKYGGSAKQVESMRGEAAKEAAKAEDALANVSRFTNNKRVGFDNGILDGDYQAKHNLCEGESCYLTYCDKNINDLGCTQYLDFDTKIKKLVDYQTIKETTQACPVFEINAGLLGIHAITEHCLIVDKMRPSINLMMSFLSVFVAFKVISSA